MTCDKSLLLRALQDVSVLVDASAAQWETLIQQAREANVLGTLACLIDERGADGIVPEQPRAHLVAARITAGAHALAVRREVAEIASALAEVVAPIVLLKGSAYLLANLPPSRGRLFSDIDILVPRATLPAVESALMQAGYVTTHHHPYDQRYYRWWMHELPPMQHVKRQTVIDVHHAIVPSTARDRHDPRLLLQSAHALRDAPGLAVLAPVDMLVHSAVHLFNDEETTHGFRDLVDLDRLLRHFGRDVAFFEALLARADTLHAGRPLHYALRWTSRLLGTPVPAGTVAAAARHAPNAAISRTMDALLDRALRPTAARASTRWARQFLYVRGHWLKMPLHLLAWHLTLKALRRQEP